MALERAIILYIEHDRPADWLERIRSAVAGQPELMAALEAAINPQPSEQALKWEAEQAVWDQEQREREARRDADRAEWVQALKADPDLVRRPPGLEPGQFSHDQLHLMASIEGEGLSTSRTRGSEWRHLIPEFGEEVARAYRDAAVMHWRHFRPGLASEGARRTTVPYSLLFGMAGLAIEFDENPGLFVDLPDDMVLLALRYAIYELNGFPTWLEPLYRARSELAAEFIWGEMRWELEHSPADQSMHYIVNDVVYHAPWLHAVVAPALIHWLRDHDTQSLDLQRNVLAILGGAESPADAIAELARAKLDGPVTPLEQRPIWYAALVGVEAADALTALEHELEALNGADSSDFAQAFVVALLGGRRATGLSGEEFRTAKAGRDLYVGGRAGFAVAPSTLAYVKGGYTNAHLDTVLGNGSVSDRERFRLNGWRIGAGLQQSIGTNTYAKLEYRYSNYEQADYRFVDGGSTDRFDVDTDRHQIVAGVGVRF